ncbi:MAG: response regulator [Betaproteobacteria bacterium]
MATLPDERFSRLKVLIIDDISAMRTALRQQLEQIDIRKVEQAASSEEALRLVQKNRYDLILCDYYLGDNTDGQQLLEHMRALGLLPPTTLFFMVTAESTHDFVSRAGECAPDDYSSSPSRPAFCPPDWSVCSSASKP